jgi:ketosteroid isomerase-like protein
MTASELDDLITRYHAAMLDIVRGNAQPAKDMYSEADDITLANPFGGVARGRAEVMDRLTKAASHYVDGEVVAFENSATYVSGDFAYLVEIERYTTRVAGRENTDEVGLRVTSIFRREAGEWKIAHRQADTRVGPQAPESVVVPGGSGQA